jgi:hypothetical protein
MEKCGISGKLQKAFALCKKKKSKKEEEEKFMVVLYDFSNNPISRS